MQSFDPRDYVLNIEYRNRKLQQLEHTSIINQVNANTHSLSLWQIVRGKHVRVILYIVIMLIALGGVAGISEAQSSSSRNVSGGSVSPSIEVALIMGDYYFKNQQYAEAISQFEYAISQMPDSLFELIPAQAIVFWQLGEALEQTGYRNEALVCYERFLDLAGTGATDIAQHYVDNLYITLQVSHNAAFKRVLSSSSCQPEKSV